MAETMTRVRTLHMDDDSECTTPEQCSRMGRDSYWPGGRPLDVFGTPTLDV